MAQDLYVGLRMTALANSTSWPPRPQRRPPWVTFLLLAALSRLPSLTELFAGLQRDPVTGGALRDPGTGAGIVDEDGKYCCCQTPATPCTVKGCDKYEVDLSGFPACADEVNGTHVLCKFQTGPSTYVYRGCTTNFVIDFTPSPHKITVKTRTKRLMYTPTGQTCPAYVDGTLFSATSASVDPGTGAFTFATADPQPDTHFDGCLVVPDGF